MTKKNKKRIIWLLIGSSIVSLGISVPLIVYNYAPFSLNRVSNSEPTNFKTEFKKLTKEQLQKINDTIQKKKRISGNNVFYDTDFPRLEFNTISFFVDIARNVKYKDQKFDFYRFPLFELKEMESFYNNIMVAELSSILNIYNYFNIILNAKKLEEILTKFYDTGTGLFKVADNIGSNVVVSSGIFKNLFLYHKSLFDKFYDADKMEKVFNNHEFTLPDLSNPSNSFAKDSLFLNIVKYIDSSRLETLFDKKNIRNWIQQWDKFISEELDKNNNDYFGSKVIFVYNIKESTKNYYPNLLSEKDLITNGRTAFVSDATTNNRKALVFSRISPAFFEGDNLLTERIELIDNLLNDRSISYDISIKNLSLSYSLLSSQENPELDKTKILNFLNDRVDKLEESLSDGSVIPDEANQIYHMAFLIKNYFENEFNETNRFLNIINQKVGTFQSITDIWKLIRALMLFQNPDDTIKISSGLYRYIRSILKSFSATDHKIYFAEMVNWINIDKAFSFKFIDDEFIKKLVNNLDNNGLGFKQFSTSLGYSLNATLNILRVTKEHFSNNSELLQKVRTNAMNLVAKLKEDSFASVFRIEEYYDYFAIIKLLNE